MKSLLKRIVPRVIFDLYYRTLEWLAAARFGFPSQKLVVIGVTGTKGKSTVVHLIGKILEEAGYKVGWISTVSFKVAEREWPNALKITMPSRFKLQRLLADMVRASCRYAIIETSSEGLAQWRHAGINYDVAVFTNLSPEHIEAHGSFEKYKEAKGRLFASLATTPRKNIGGKTVEKVSVVSADDPAAKYFAAFPADRLIQYSRKQSQAAVHSEKVERTLEGSTFELAAPSGSTQVSLALLGQMGVENSLAAAAVAISQGVSLEVIARALAKVPVIPGRMEQIRAGQDFEVFVDYAHEPKSLEAVYQTLKSRAMSHTPPAKLICVLGAAGGGRDRWKRPVLGRLAGQYCDVVIITNEDPYDEDPRSIIDEVARGAETILPVASRTQKVIGRIFDRREAIAHALSLAKKGDVVVITGKGSEGIIMGPRGKRIPHDDRQVVRDFFANLSQKDTKNG